MRLPEPAEQDAQHRVGVGRGADGGPRVRAHPLLVDDDRRRQALQEIDLGPRQRRHEALHERAVGLVDQPLRLRGDRAEHQRALARAGDAGEHRQPALRDLDADVLEVVHARALHADQVVAVGTRAARDACRRALGPLLIVSPSVRPLASRGLPAAVGVDRKSSGRLRCDQPLREGTQVDAWPSGTTPSRLPGSSTCPASPSTHSCAFRHHSRPRPSDASSCALMTSWPFFPPVGDRTAHPAVHTSWSSSSIASSRRFRWQSR